MAVPNFLLLNNTVPHGKNDLLLSWNARPGEAWHDVCMAAALWLPVSLLSESIPSSVWLSKLILGIDIRKLGDGNPGASNVFRARSSFLGIITLLLDVSKAALLVGVCYSILEIRSWVMTSIVVASILAGNCISLC